jgi:hypothetical protein
MQSLSSDPPAPDVRAHTDPNVIIQNVRIQPCACPVGISTTTFEEVEGHTLDELLAASKGVQR